MALTAEVVIVGGGIVGCATAYWLAKAGVRSTIVEREAVGSQASGYAAGLLNPLNGHGIPGPIEDLARENFKIHLDLAEEIRAETGVDPMLRPLPGIWTVFEGSEAHEVQELYELAIRLDGFEARWLDGSEVRSLEPRVSNHVVRGMCVEGARQVDSYRLTLGLAEAAEKYGAAIVHGTFEGLKRDGGRVCAVVVSGEDLACDRAVLAMGPWAGMVESWLGVGIPISPLKGQILRLELEGPPLDHAFYDGAGGYITSKPDGLIWVGTTEEPVGFDDRPTAEAREGIMREATRTLPALCQARLALQTACLRPVSEDGLPIIGEVPGWDGVYLATGAGRKGILLGPAMGKATADLITTGTTGLPIGQFSPARFVKS